MAKGKMKSVFFCKDCGYESAKWMGQCPACKAWNTMTEEVVSASSKAVPSVNRGEAPKPVKISEISLSDEDRISTGMDELDRVLGGGIVPGSLVLVGGDPGIGKSTVLMQICQ